MVGSNRNLYKRVHMCTCHIVIISLRYPENDQNICLTNTIVQALIYMCIISKEKYDLHLADGYNPGSKALNHDS